MTIYNGPELLEELARDVKEVGGIANFWTPGKIANVPAAVAAMLKSKGIPGDADAIQFDLTNALTQLEQSAWAAATAAARASDLIAAAIEEGRKADINKPTFVI